MSRFFLPVNFVKRLFVSGFIDIKYLQISIVLILNVL